MTLEDIARMMKRGFDDLRTEFLGETGVLRTEVGKIRKDLSSLQGDITELQADMSEVKGEVSEINGRLEEFYYPEIEKHGRRIKDLEKSAGR